MQIIKKGTRAFSLLNCMHRYISQRECKLYKLQRIVYLNFVKPELNRKLVLLLYTFVLPLLPGISLIPELGGVGAFFEQCVWCSKFY